IIREVVCPALLILKENTNISKVVSRFISLPEDMLELDLLERSLNNSDISNDILYRPLTRIIRLQELDDVEGVTFNLEGIITKFDSQLKAFEDGQGFRTMVTPDAEYVGAWQSLIAPEGAGQPGEDLNRRRQARWRYQPQQLT
ncbi:hypothetical protein KI387_003435, partial [Taxus chinensis]